MAAATRFSTAEEIEGRPRRWAGPVRGMAWTYIIECADGTFYCGSTIDLERRISEHDRGEGAAYTRLRRRRPVTLRWAAQFDRIDEAFAYEKRIRKWSRAKRIALIEGRYDDLPGLARGHRCRPLADPDSQGAAEAESD